MHEELIAHDSLLWTCDLNDLSGTTLLIQKKIVHLQKAYGHNMTFMIYRVCISCLFLKYSFG